MGINERKERERNNRRRLILEAAEHVYLKEGYHSTTMEKIAEMAELSRAAIYLHFKTKNEIFVHAVVSFLEHFRNLIEDLYERREYVGEHLLMEVWNIFEKLYLEEPEALNATNYFLQSDMIRNLPDDLRLLIDHAGIRTHDSLFRIIKYGASRDYFGEYDPKRLAEILWTCFLGVVNFENTKKAMGRKDHFNINCKVIYDILSKGILSRGV